jgi:RNA polymerase-interacting CarD/CdnL/TRCF family regulator
MHSMLAYLGGTLGAPVPAAVLESLGARRASRTERLAHLARVTPQVRGRKLAMVWERYRKLALEQSGSTGPAGLASFLQRLWRLERRRQIPAELLRRTLKHGFSRDH